MSIQFAMPKSSMLMLVVAAVGWASAASATIVRFQTPLGIVDVRLYDGATPLSVANFLGYANADRYNGSFIHRSPPGFVVQGGGFRFTALDGVIPVVDPDNPDAPVLNEPGISNLRGTLAYAKFGNDPHSATSQWFFNLKDNSGPPPSLDTTNGGFTVFGRVILNGMSVVDAIDQLPEYDLDPFPQQTFDQVPLCCTSNEPLANRLIYVYSVDVLNLPAGDYDFNGIVNAADYNVWRSTFGSKTSAEADGNGNGVVDAADYVIWRNTFGQTTGGGGSSAVVGSVPEATTAILLLLAAPILAHYRRRPSK